MKTLFADTVNGIMEKGDDDHVTSEVSESLFVSMLPCLDDGEYIKCSTVSDMVYDSLKEQYGIHQ